MNYKLSIEYCTKWGYLGRAVALIRKVLNEHKNKISEVKLLPSSDGVFEVVLNDELIFSKKELGRHGEKDEIEGIIRGKIE